MEKLKKTKKHLPIILELLAKVSCQLLDPNPIVACTEPLVTFESLVITRKLLTDGILYAKLGRRSQWPCGLRHEAAYARMLGLRVRISPEACCAIVLYSTLAQQAGMPP